MLNLKKTAVAVLALGSSAVFAGTMGPVCTPGNVTVPCEKCAWNIGGYALYLEPAYTSPDFTHVPFVFDGVGTYRSVNSNPSWGWGFKIEGSYHFNTGNDFNLNWYHWNRSTHNTYEGVVFGDSDVTLPLVSADRYVGPRWDAANFEFGQHVDFSEWDSIRLHAGVQYARVKHDIAIGGPAILATGAVVNPAYYNVAHSTFNGFGPRVGADMNYMFGNGFSIYGDGAAAILVGNSGHRQDIVRATAAGVSTPIFYNNSHRAIVPELEARLGAKYSYCMAQGDLALDVGWMWANYFNVNQIRRAAVSAAGVPQPGALADTNFGIQGLYFGLKWVGSV